MGSLVAMLLIVYRRIKLDGGSASSKKLRFNRSLGQEFTLTPSARNCATPFPWHLPYNANQCLAKAQGARESRTVPMTAHPTNSRQVQCQRRPSPRFRDTPCSRIAAFHWTSAG